MEFRYFFLKRDNKVNICHVGDQSIELLRPGGSVSFEYNDQLFTRWKDKVGYDGESVDFCFMSDDSLPEELKAFSMVEESTFTVEMVKACILKIFNSKIHFSFNEQNVEIQMDNDSSSYNCNLSFESAVEIQLEKSEESVETKIVMPKPNSLAEYYYNKTKDYEKDNSKG